jgi:hypothetical protein
MVFSILPANTESAAYEIDNSLRFNNADNVVLAYTPSSSSSDANKRKYTFSLWVKRSDLGREQGMINWGKQTGAEDFELFFDSDDTIRVFDYGDDFGGSGFNYDKKTDAEFRDPSAWYHIFVRVDTTDGTAGDRVQLYVNGVRITSFSSSTDPSQNYAGFVGSADVCDIGTAENKTARTLGAYLSEVHYIDGTAKEYTDFGEFNDNGVWIPKKYTGSYGTNGWFLEFQQTGTGTNSSGMGADTSGNDNHFAPSNLAATDVTTDTPTNNFATLNIVNKYASPVVAEGALEYDSNSSSGSSLVSTIAPSNGKWYVEVKALTSTMHIGVSEVGLEAFNVKGQGATRPNINYQYGGGVEIDGSIIDNEATFTSNDILGFALNLDDGELIIYKNGTALNSGTAYNLHTNTTHGNTGFSVQTATGSGNTKASFNFGNPAFSISSGNADANGYGNFEYAPPSGYYALCTKNLAEFG